MILTSTDTLDILRSLFFGRRAENIGNGGLNIYRTTLILFPVPTAAAKEYNRKKYEIFFPCPMILI